MSALMIAPRPAVKSLEAMFVNVIDWTPRYCAPPSNVYSFCRALLSDVVNDKEILRFSMIIFPDVLGALWFSFVATDTLYVPASFANT